MNKTCTKCGTEKSEDGFYGNKSECKECSRARSREYAGRPENAEKIKENRKKYLDNNKGIEARWQKEWRDKNKDKAKKTRQEWEIKNHALLKERKKKYAQKNKKRQSTYQRSYQLMSKYGITIDEYVEMVSLQGGRCLCCGVADHMLSVDHDHATKKVRGLLCMGCNIAIGHIKDNKDTAVAIAAYLSGEKK